MQIVGMAGPDQDMAERLRHAREKIAGIDTAAEAARRLRIDYQTYVAHENGSRGFTRSASRYAGFYKVNLTWLLTGAGSPRGSNLEARFMSLDTDQQKIMLEMLDMHEKLKASRAKE